MVKIKRIYEPYMPDVGYRILVDRLWPRGINKEDARIDLWMKDISPSHELRKWFNHEPAKWQEFLAKYQKEIDNSLLLEIKRLETQHATVTLLFAARDQQHNNAVAILSFLNN